MTNERVSTESLTESEQHLLESESRQKISNLQNLRDQLLRLGNFDMRKRKRKILVSVLFFIVGFIDDTENSKTDIMKAKKNSLCLECSLDTLISDKKINEDFLSHIQNVLKYTVLKLAAKLSEVGMHLIQV